LRFPSLAASCFIFHLLYPSQESRQINGARMAA
jgi:hypothetical protein